MNIKKITLLTLDEFSKYKEHVPYISGNWWLKNSSVGFQDAYIVVSKYGFAPTDKTNIQGVRPALIVEELITFPEDKLNLFGLTWTTLDGDPNNTILLCDSIITTHCYDKNKFKWPDSEIKNLLDNWLSEKLADSEIVVTYKNKTEFLFLQALCEKYQLNKLYSIHFTSDKHLVYSPYQPWKIAREKPIRTTLSFSEFCDYITNNLLIF